jgi:hypothetical protein
MNTDSFSVIYAFEKVEEGCSISPLSNLLERGWG